MLFCQDNGDQHRKERQLSMIFHFDHNRRHIDSKILMVRWGAYHFWPWKRGSLTGCLTLRSNSSFYHHHRHRSLSYFIENNQNVKTQDPGIFPLSIFHYSVERFFIMVIRISHPISLWHVTNHNQHLLKSPPSLSKFHRFCSHYIHISPPSASLSSSKSGYPASDRHSAPWAKTNFHHQWLEIGKGRTMKSDLWL